MSVYKALTIAGSDSGGGAGIQADLKTFQELDVFGMSALTAVTAQNTLGVQGVYPMSVEAVMEQIDSIAVDLAPHALKTGMLFNGDLIQAVSEKIKTYNWTNVIVDPVMIAKGGAPLLQEEAVSALIEYLIPLSLVITPNLPEAEVLIGSKIKSFADRKDAAKMIHQMGAKNVVIKGGHGQEEKLIDLLYDGDSFYEFTSTRVNTKHTHGTGCTFSAAIAAEVAKGKSVSEAVCLGKVFITAAIEDQLGIGAGHGPTNHSAYKKRGLTTV